MMGGGERIGGQQLDTFVGPRETIYSEQGKGATIFAKTAHRQGGKEKTPLYSGVNFARIL